MRAHEWTVIAEFDAGYVLGRCRVCGEQDLLDVAALVPVPRAAATPAPTPRPTPTGAPTSR